MLKGKKILIGVCGSISAYKACDLVRLLRKEECEVRVVMTKSATELVSPLTFTALCGHPAKHSMFDEKSATGMEHIDLARWADHYVIAPATANSIGEMALGLTGSLVSSLFLAFGKKAVITPAMNSQMLLSPQVQKNISILKSYGHYILPTLSGELACGELGLGKLLEPVQIVEYLKAVDAVPHALDLSGLKITIALGHTREKWDDIRFWSNRSSGKTGLAIARSAKLFGADIILLKGHTESVSTADFETGSDLSISCSNTQDFNKNMAKILPHSDIVIMAAALADFIPAKTLSGKKSQSSTVSTVPMKPAANVMETVIKAKKPEQIVAAFALQNEGNEQEALKKWTEHGADILVINTPLSAKKDEGFGQNNIRACVLSKSGWKNFGDWKKAPKLQFKRMDKFQLGHELLKKVQKIRGSK